MTNQTYNEESRGVAMNIFAVLGFIAILIAGLWATVQLVKQISNLSFDFNKPTISMPSFGGNDKLTLIKNENTFRSGEGTKIQWTLGKDAQKAEGSTLTFSYACKAGAYIKVGDATTGSYRAIPCNAPYSIPTTYTELSIIPVLTNKNENTLAYSLAYTPKGGKVESVSSVLAISKTAKSVKVAQKPAAKTVTRQNTNTKPVPTLKEGVTHSRIVTPAPVKTARKVPAHKTITQKKTTVHKIVPVRTSNPNGLPDLTVKILAVQPTNMSNKIAIKFEVANIGTKLANGWTFTATLPTEPAYTYVSEAQGALYAGERAEMLMTFDKLKSGSNPLVITVDSQNAITESVEINNAVLQNIVGKQY